MSSRKARNIIRTKTEQVKGAGLGLVSLLRHPPIGAQGLGFPYFGKSIPLHRHAHFGLGQRERRRRHVRLPIPCPGCLQNSQALRARPRCYQVLPGAARCRSKKTRELRCGRHFQRRSFGRTREDARGRRMPEGARGESARNGRLCALTTYAVANFTVTPPTARAHRSGDRRRWDAPHWRLRRGRCSRAVVFPRWPWGVVCRAKCLVVTVLRRGHHQEPIVQWLRVSTAALRTTDIAVCIVTEGVGVLPFAT
jgi:hypothetical protein